VGTIDEAVAALGLARAASRDEELSRSALGLQRDLFVAAADLAANPRARDRLVPGISLLTSDMVADVETQIDRLVADRPLRPVFVVPGANPASAALDLARTIVRRAERRLLAQSADQPSTTATNPQVAIYLNRVGDLIYVLARHAAAGQDEPASHDGIPVPRPSRPGQHGTGPNPSPAAAGSRHGDAGW
jgi:cob(I)alamin adenosyltransferase